MYVLLLHVIVDGKLLEITFWYPPSVSKQIESEIVEITKTLTIH